MPYKVAAFYQFAALPDFAELRQPLRAICARFKLKGSVLLAHEGINGTLAGEPKAIDDFVAELRDGVLFGGRLDRLELKFSQAAAMPFQRLKVRLKKEIVTLGDANVDPTRQVGIYVEPADWNALIDVPDTLVLDTRNAFEVALGTFEGAVNPGLTSFGQFKDFAARHLDPAWPRLKKQRRYWPVANQIVRATIAITTILPITGATRFELPLRGESFGAWLNRRSARKPNDLAISISLATEITETSKPLCCAATHGRAWRRVSTAKVAPR